MNGDFQFIDILIFAFVAIMLAQRLKNVLGTRPDNEKDDQDKKDKIINIFDHLEKQIREAEAVAKETSNEEGDVVKEEISPMVEKINQLKKIDPKFNEKQFIDGAKIAFEMIVKAFAAGDLETLKKLLNPKMFDGFKKVVDERAERGEKAECELVGFESVEINHVELMGTVADISVRFASEQVNIVKDKNGKVIIGDEKFVQNINDIWTFSRDLKSPNPNWQLVSTR